MDFSAWSGQDLSAGGSEGAPLATGVRTASTGRGVETYDAVVRWALFVVALIVPLFFLPWTTGVLETNKQLLVVLAAGVALMAWLLGVVMSGTVRLRPTVLDVAVGGLFLSTFLGTIFSMAIGKSMFGLSLNAASSLTSVLALSLLYFLAAYTVRDHGARIRTALIIGSTLALVIALLQVFGVYLFPVGFAQSRAFNTVGSVNAAGVLAAILLPLFLKARVGIRGIPRIDIAKVGALAAFLLLLVLNWWVLWLIAGVGMLAVIGMDSVAAAITRGTGGRWSMSRFLIPMTVIVLAVFLLVVNFSFPIVKNNLPVEIAPSAKLSLSITERVLATSTVTGYGPENFHLAFDKFGASSLANSTFLNLRFFDAMSEAFNRVIQEGILGILAILGLVYGAVRALTHLRAALADQARSAYAVGVGASLIAALAAFFLYPLNLTLSFILVMLLALVALLIPSSGERDVDIEDKPVFSLGASLGFVIGLIAVLTGWYYVGAAYAADVVFARAVNDSDTTHAIDGMVFAANLNSANDAYYRNLSQATLTLLNEELNKGNVNDPDRQGRIQSYVQSAISLARRSTEIAPLDANNWYNLGSVYQSLMGLVDGVEKLAEEAYQKASDFRPGDPTFVNRVGTMYLSRADLSRQLARSGGANAGALSQNAEASLLQAESAFKEAIELSPDFGMAIYNLGAVYDRQGKTNEAIQQLERIIPANADQPNLLFELGLLYYRVNRRDDSFAAFQRAVVLAPQFANARWYLALILEERKDLEGAIRQLEAIVETNKDNTTVLEKITQLRSGKSSIPPQRVIDQEPL